MSQSPPARPPYLPPAYDDETTVLPPIVGLDGVATYRGIRVDTQLGYRPLALDLLVPASDQPVPVVAYIHGGAFLFGSRRNDRVAEPLWQALLDDGFAVASLEYRLSGEAPFPACLHDAAAAVRWLRTFGGAFGLAAERIGVVGESAGGHLTAFLGLNLEDRELIGWGGPFETSAAVQAAVPWYPPTDFLTMDAQADGRGAMLHDAPGSPESLLVGVPIQDDPELTRRASPIGHVNADAAPMLLLHGADDSLVPPQQSVTFAEALTRAGGTVEVELIPGAEHVFDGVDRTPIIARTLAHLRAHLL